METTGRHVLAEYSGCDVGILNDIDAVKAMMERAAVAAKTRIVASVFQPFEPQGVTGVVVIEESHLSIHTWPEYGYAAVDFFTCGEGDPEAAHAVIRDALKATACEKMFIERGIPGGPGAPAQGMRLRSHTTEHGADTRSTSDASRDDASAAPSHDVRPS